MIADEVIQKAPPTAEELGLTVGGDSKALPPVDVAAQLQLEISGFIMPDTTPFSSAVSAWVQLSGVPTGVDLDSFAAAGLDPYRTVGIKEANNQVARRYWQVDRCGSRCRLDRNQQSVSRFPSG